MKILITGGAGFIGSNLAKGLLKQNIKNMQLYVLDDLSSGKLENLEDVKNKVEFIKGSITNVETLRNSMENIDYVFHMAAKVAVEESVLHPLENHLVNSLGTLNVLNTAREMNVKRVIYSSSASVYGNPLTAIVNENVKVDPLSPYALQKYSGERYSVYFNKYYGFETVCLRYFNVYGPSQQENGGYAGVVFRFFSDGIKNKKLKIEGEGEQTRDFVFVEDVVRANILAMKTDSKNCGDVYNVGTGKETSINELANVIAQIIGKEGVKIEHVEARKEDIKRSRADISKIDSSLGFTPSVNLIDGLTKTYEWIKFKV